MLRPRREVRRRALTVVPIPTRSGIFTAHFSERGLAQLDFPDQAARGAGQSSKELLPELSDWIELTKQAVSAILSGRRAGALPPIDVRAGTDFQRRVWAALQRISFGETRSYSEVAAAIGSPKALRAVGSACGANPIPLLIPCHRVLASGGKLGGFSGGLSWKKRLLAAEGVLEERRQGSQRLLFEASRL